MVMVLGSKKQNMYIMGINKSDHSLNVINDACLRNFNALVRPFQIIRIHRLLKENANYISKIFLI